MSERFLRLFKNKLDEVAKARADGVLNGQVESWDKYQNHVGFLQGLTKAAELADEVEKENEGH